MVQALKTIPAHLEYFFKVVNEHSLQSPFIYEFYTSLKTAVRKGRGLERIENIRAEFLKNNMPVGGMDMGAGSRLSSPKTVAAIARHGISTKKECLMLAALARQFRSGSIVELGTSLGIATAYLADACSGGTIYSFEGNEDLLGIADKVAGQLSMKNIRFFQGDIDETLPWVLRDLEHVDLAIIDANHKGDALLRYFHWLKNKMSKAGLIVVDDIRWSADMYKTWRDILSDEKVTLSIDFHKSGVLFFDSYLRKQHFFLSL